MADVKFIDNSIQVKAALNDTTIDWLYEEAAEIASLAQRNCSTGEEYSSQLRGSYKAKVNEQKGEAYVGSGLEQAFWEEFGTGAYADTSKNGGKKGRKDWWIYIPGGPPGVPDSSTHYATKEEAEQMAAYIRAKYDKPAIVSNGKKPNYTLEKSFTARKPTSIANLERKLKEEMG